MKIKDIKGKVYADLTAINFVKTDKERRSWWLCRCVCGNNKIVRLDSLQALKTKSCGCQYKKHGLIKTRFYKIWRHMKTRCFNPKTKGFNRWGGRGITVGKEWMDFINFRNDMYESYKNHVRRFGKKDTTLDRIDNNGNYTKGNCKWSTASEQSKNQVSNVFYKINGEKLCLTDWARKRKINYRTVCSRLNCGWPIEKALNL